jgi:hypothetical protein
VRDWLTEGASIHAPAVILLQQLKPDGTKNNTTSIKDLIEGRKAVYNDQDLVLSCRKREDETRVFKLEKCRDPLMRAPAVDMKWADGAYVDALLAIPEPAPQTVQQQLNEVF